MRPAAVLVIITALAAITAAVLLVSTQDYAFTFSSPSTRLVSKVAHEVHTVPASKPFLRFVDETKLTRTLNRHEKLLSNVQISLQDGAFRDSLPPENQGDRVACYAITMQTESDDTIQVLSRRIKARHLTASLIRSIEDGIDQYYTSTSRHPSRGGRTITVS